MAAIESAAIDQFRNSVRAALATSDKSAFDNAARTLSAATRTNDVFSLPAVQGDQQLSELLSLAADMHWVRPPTWASVLKRRHINSHSTDPISRSVTTTNTPNFVLSPSLLSTKAAPRGIHSVHLNANTAALHWYHPNATSQQAFIPPFPSQPVPLPITIATTVGGVRTSFRSWKWHRTSSNTSNAFRHAGGPVTAVPSANAFDKTWAPPNTSLGHAETDNLGVDEDEDVLSTMRITPATRAAGVTAAAAFQALKPFLQPEQRNALRHAISYTQPLQALDIVVDAVHAACARFAASEGAASSSVGILGSKTDTGGASDVIQGLWSGTVGSPTNSGGTNRLKSVQGNVNNATSIDLGSNVNGLSMQGVSLEPDGPWSPTVWTADARDVAWRPLSSNVNESADRIATASVNASISGSRLDVNATPFIGHGMDTAIRDLKNEDRL